MRLVPCLLLLLAGSAVRVLAADVAGNWHLDFVSGDAPTTAGDADFKFKVDGQKLTGTARIGVGGWPADGPIAEGTSVGDHIAFRVDGKMPSSSGYPKMRFTGTVHGDDINLAMMLFYRDDKSDAIRSNFKGKRVSH